MKIYCYIIYGKCIHYNWNSWDSWDIIYPNNNSNHGINYESLKLDKLPKLTKSKKLTIHFLEGAPTFRLFDNYLNQLEVFEVSNYDLTIKVIIERLNPDKSKPFIIASINDLNLEGLNTIKRISRNQRHCI